MDICTVSLKNYKNIFLQVVLLNAFAVCSSYAIVSWWPFDQVVIDGKQFFVDFLLGAMIILAVTHTFYTKKQLSKLLVIEDFNTRVTEHVKIYKIRMLWYLGACFVSCIIYVLTTRVFFLYFAIFDFASSLPLYPNKSVFKKELMNDDIVFH